MAEAILIRAARAADAGEVQSLFATHLSELGLQPDSALDADMGAFPRSYAHPPASFLVAQAPTGTLVGMAGFLAGEIRRVFVRPEWRGQGIAKRLVLALIRTAQAALDEPAALSGARLRLTATCQRVRAVVASDNTASRRLFEACGFKPAGRTSDHPCLRRCEVLERALREPVHATAR